MVPGRHLTPEDVEWIALSLERRATPRPPRTAPPADLPFVVEHEPAVPIFPPPPRAA